MYGEQDTAVSINITAIQTLLEKTIPEDSNMILSEGIATPEALEFVYERLGEPDSSKIVGFTVKKIDISTDFRRIQTMYATTEKGVYFLETAQTNLSAPHKMAVSSREVEKFNPATEAEVQRQLKTNGFFNFA